MTHLYPHGPAFARFSRAGRYFPFHASFAVVCGKSGEVGSQFEQMTGHFGTEKREP